MEQVFIPYWDWEDWKNGMWRKLNPKDEAVMLKKAIKFTGDHIKYGDAMKKVVNEWPKTMLNGLTNVSINRRAFLGHCAVSYKLDIPEYITRMAWKRLTDKQRRLADMVAQKTINDYERKDRGIHKRLGKQMLLQWDS